MNENEFDLEVGLVRQRIMLALKDDKVPYSIALTALARAMMDIVVLGLGKEEREARAVCSSLFIVDPPN